MQAKGGVLTDNDFGNYSTVLQQPAEITYQGKCMFRLIHLILCFNQQIFVIEVRSLSGDHVHLNKYIVNMCLNETREQYRLIGKYSANACLGGHGFFSYKIHSFKIQIH